MGVLAGVANCGRSWKWGYGGGSRLEFKLKAGHHKVQETMQNQAGRKGMRALSLVGQEEMPLGFGLRTGDRGNTDDGAGSCGRSAQLSTDY